ncbi:tetratricopeptide repeat protein [Streptomyces sp. NPDC001843]|uniref:tetratricopeptide repeat protein n=1 Tax=Streptomyces sp. NPDC001843 TaxID=3364617 RepID=UPI0036B5BDA6
MADALHSAGDHAAAADRYERVLTQRRRVLGSEHPDTLASRLGLDTCRAEQHQGQPSTSRSVRRRGRGRASH